MITHHQLVKTRAKSGNTILSEMSELEAHLIHMCLGIAGEVGEMVEHLEQYPWLVREEIIIEAGDLEFYIEGYHQGLETIGIEAHIDHGYIIACTGAMQVALGLISASSAIVEQTKKFVIYHKTFKDALVSSELVRIHGFLSALYNLIGVTRNEVIDINIAKLTKRYESVYSDEAAINRIDVK